MGGWVNPWRPVARGPAPLKLTDFFSLAKVFEPRQADRAASLKCPLRKTIAVSAT
jgi:hypothetical protein